MTDFSKYDADEVFAEACDYWDTLDSLSVEPIVEEVKTLLEGHRTDNETLAVIASEAFFDACDGADVRNPDKHFAEHFPLFADLLGGAR